MIDQDRADTAAKEQAKAGSDTSGRARPQATHLTGCPVPHISFRTALSGGIPAYISKPWFMIAIRCAKTLLSGPHNNDLPHLAHGPRPIKTEYGDISLARSTTGAR